MEALELIESHYDELNPNNIQEKQECLGSLKKQYEQILENLEISFQES